MGYTGCTPSLADISPVERRETTGRGFATQYAPHAHCATLVMTDTYTCGNLRICTVPNRRYLLLYAFTKKGGMLDREPRGGRGFRRGKGLGRGKTQIVRYSQVAGNIAKLYRSGSGNHTHLALKSTNSYGAFARSLQSLPHGFLTTAPYRMREHEYSTVGRPRML